MSEPETARETHVSAYFDSELDAPSMQEVERALAGDPGLAEDLEDFGHLKSAIVAELEREAADVPAARFEQVWDEVERGIRSSAASEATPASGGLAGALASLWSSWRAPLMVGAAAGIVGIVVFQGPDGETEPGRMAQGPDPVEAVQPTPKTPAPVVVEAEAPAAGSLVSFQRPEEFDGEVEAVEFSGGRGQIVRTTDQDGKQRGITIWFDEIEDAEEEEAAEGGHRI